MSKNGTIKDEDFGLKALLSKIAALPPESSVQVGIQEGSPKSQFRYGKQQKFRPETGDLLLRQAVDENKEEIQSELLNIGVKVLFDDVDMNSELMKLGNDIKVQMDAQTDNPPQLRNSIIVTIDA